MVLFPASAFSSHRADPSYSATADSTAAVACSTNPVDGETTCGTINENTVSSNSEGGIVEDQPGTVQNEANDTTIATATPVRVETSDGTRANPDSIAATAPNDAAGTSNTGVVTVGDGNGFIAASSEGTHSEVDAHASSNESTVNSWSWSNGVDQTAGPGNTRVVLPNTDSFAFNDRFPSGDIFAGASNVASSDGAQQISMAGGLITMDFVSASSGSWADGHGGSNNVIDFSVDNLEVHSAPFGGVSLITINHADNFLNEAVMTINATINGVTDTFTAASGRDLFERNTYADSAVLFAEYLNILGALNNLTGIGGALEGASLRLGGGWSDDGNGDYARGMSQAVALEYTHNGWDTEQIVGYAYSGVDAVRPFSTATDPLWPAGVVPVVDAERAFPATRNAFPVETIFANGPAETSAVLGANDLPRTGLEIGALVLFGLLLVAGGFGTRRFSRSAA
jgi:hypothetical protein